MTGVVTSVFLPNIVLDESNYPSWVFRMESFLRGQKLFEFIDGSKPCPPQTETQAYADWNVTDQNIINIVGQTLSPVAIRCVVGSKTSKEMWENLKKKFADSNRQNIVQLKTNFQSIKKGGDSIEVYLDRIKAAKDALETVGVRLPDEDVVVAVLGGLPFEYAAIKTVIRAQSVSSTLGELKTLLKGAEHDIECEAQSVSMLPMTAMIAKTESQSQALLSSESCKSAVPFGYSEIQQACPSALYVSRDYSRDNSGAGKGNSGEHAEISARIYNPVNSVGYQTRQSGGNGNGRFNGRGNSVVCQLCGRSGHIAKNCYDLPSYGDFNKRQQNCQLCGKRNHTADKCFHLIGFPNQQKGWSSGGFKSHTQSRADIEALFAANTGAQGRDNPGFWMADSGATNHMTSDMQLLQNVTAYPGNDKVQIGNGEHLLISHMGDSCIGDLAMPKVLLIPSLAANLLSPYQLCKQNNCRMIFDEFSCVIQDKKQGKVLFQGPCKKGLYPIPCTIPDFQFSKPNLASSLQHHFASSGNHAVSICPDAASCLSGQNGDHAVHTHVAMIGNRVAHSLWHKRLGHPSNVIVSTMLAKSHISSSIDSYQSQNVCESCLAGKFSKLPFDISMSRSSRPFELIHSDVWGPSPVVSIDGYRYYVLFIDDYTRFTWMFPMKNKHEVFTHFQTLFAYVTTQFTSVIKILRSDGGGEYVNIRFREFLSSKGILHQLSCPYTPQQNGVSERKNRHIRETAVTLLHDGSLPLKFWYFACAMAIFLINRMPSESLQMSSPYELLFGSIPLIDHVRVFGCACYPLMTPYNSNKLQPKTARCVFIGFAVGYKGFVCYHLGTGKLIVSRHVMFDETFFPFHTVTSLTSPPASASSSQNCSQPSVLPIYQNWSSPTASSSQSLPESCDLILDDVPTDLPVVAPSNSAINMGCCDPSDSCGRLDDESPSNNSPIVAGPAAAAPSLSHTDNPGNQLCVDFTASNPSSSSTLPLTERDIPGASCVQPFAVSLSETNILHPVEGLSPVVTNAHSMITRGKRGIVKKKCLLSVAAVPSSNPVEVEPCSYKFALQIPEWKRAMQEEISALQAQHTWVLVPLPIKKNCVSCKWVFRLKRNSDGSIARHKARLVARGFTQEKGVDYEETFSPVVRHTTVRIVIRLAAAFGWQMHQLDVKNAFLHGELKEEVYMDQPGGFEDPRFPSYVCKLQKSLYGLKQAPRAWNARFTSFLPKLGFHPSHADPSLFVRIDADAHTFLLLYVDDIVLTGSSSTLVDDLKSQLKHEFEMTDLGRLHYFLGLEVRYLADGSVFLSQQQYAKGVLHKAGLAECHPCLTPCQSGIKLLKDTGQPLSDSDASEFRSIVGCLQYLTFTRPDIAYSVNSVCQFMHQPTDLHFKAAIRILRYVKGTLDFGVNFPKNGSSGPVDLHAYCDADWAGDPNDRKSTTGFVILLNRSPVSWCSRKQASVSRSSTEAEYRSMADTASEVQWINHLLCDLGVSMSQVPTLFCDNVSAIALANDPVHKSKMKHVEVDVHFTREKVKEGVITIRFVSTAAQLADLFTKGLCSPQHNFLRSSLLLQHPAEGG
ncbi:hypothetical protein Dimus_038297 [Dionaea muscipula]